MIFFAETQVAKDSVLLYFYVCGYRNDKNGHEQDDSVCLLTELKVDLLVTGLIHRYSHFDATN
jgi:hypothetical protein